MVEVKSLDGITLYVCLAPDADFKTYGYYYEIYLDKDMSRLYDYGNTYDQDEDSSWEWVCNIAEIMEVYPKYI